MTTIAFTPQFSFTGSEVPGQSSVVGNIGDAILWDDGSEILWDSGPVVLWSSGGSIQSDLGLNQVFLPVFNFIGEAD